MTGQESTSRLLEGEKMAELCREVDISRKTDDTILRRDRDPGIEGLKGRSGGPFRRANRLPMPDRVVGLVAAVVAAIAGLGEMRIFPVYG